MSVRIVRLGTARLPDEGLRIGTVRQSGSHRQGIDRVGHRLSGNFATAGDYLGKQRGRARRKRGR